MCLQDELKQSGAAAAADAGQWQVSMMRMRMLGTEPNNAMDRRRPAVHSPASLQTQTHNK